jgi:general secretion pathway protein D
MFAGALHGQTTVTAQNAPQAQQVITETGLAAPPRESDRRHAAKLYLAASKLFMDARFEEAMEEYDRAAKLDPTNPNYGLAANVARSHAVTALIQTAAKDRLRGDVAGTRDALARALKLDPKSIEATQHLYELSDDAVRGQIRPLYEHTSDAMGAPAPLAPNPARHSFHLRNGQRQIVQQVFKAYGIDASATDSIQFSPMRFDIDDATFDQATRALALATDSFYVPLDPHRVLVARDTKANRQEFTRQEMETIYLPGLKAEEMTEVGNLAKQVFGIQQSVLQPSAGTITIRAPRDALEAFNTTIRTMIDGHSQVLLDVRLLQVAHVSSRNTGVTTPQSFSAYNVYAEEQALLSENQDLVAEIISSGLAAEGDTLAIIGILLASGEVSSSLFSNGIAVFGGGITQSALAPGGATMHFNLNSSDTRALDQIQMRLGDGEAGTLKEGERYPIQTSSFSSLSSSSSTIAGLTGAGTSSSLAALLAAATSSATSVPQVEYQDLGLNLKATANVMRNGDVALSLDMKITALSGSTINDNPILNNRAYSGVITIEEGSAVVVASELSRSESRAISGTPGLSDIPGMNDLTSKNGEKNFATLLLIVTPHVIRGTQASGHTPMLRIERNALSQ